MPNPIQNEELYRSIVLAGVRSPGQVTLSGHDRSVGWDVKKGPGIAGAIISRSTDEPIEFTASFYLVLDNANGVDDLEQWPAFQKLIDSSVAGKTPKALDIYHPDLASNGIKSVVKKSISGVSHDGKGGQTITVKFLEWFPPKKISGSPKSKPKNDPNADVKRELEQLTEKYKATPWG